MHLLRKIRKKSHAHDGPADANMPSRETLIVALGAFYQQYDPTKLGSPLEEMVHNTQRNGVAWLDTELLQEYGACTGLSGPRSGGSDLTPTSSSEHTAISAAAATSTMSDMPPPSVPPVDSQSSPTPHSPGPAPPPPPLRNPHPTPDASAAAAHTPMPPPPRRTTATTTEAAVSSPSSVSSTTSVSESFPSAGVSPAMPPPRSRTQPSIPAGNSEGHDDNDDDDINPPPSFPAAGLSLETDAEVDTELMEQVKRVRTPPPASSRLSASAPPTPPGAGVGDLLYKNLESALRSKGLTAYLEPLHQQGVESFEDMSTMDPDDKSADSFWADINYMDKKRLKMVVQQAKEVVARLQGHQETSSESATLGTASNGSKHDQPSSIGGVSPGALAQQVLMRRQQSLKAMRDASTADDRSNRASGTDIDTTQPSPSPSPPPPPPMRTTTGQHSGIAGTAAAAIAEAVVAEMAKTVGNDGVTESQKVSEPASTDDDDDDDEVENCSPPPPPPRRTHTPAPPSATASDVDDDDNVATDDVSVEKSVSKTVPAVAQAGALMAEMVAARAAKAATSATQERTTAPVHQEQDKQPNDNDTDGDNDSSNDGNGKASATIAAPVASDASTPATAAAVSKHPPPPRRVVDPTTPPATKTMTASHDGVISAAAAAFSDESHPPRAPVTIPPRPAAAAPSAKQQRHGVEGEREINNITKANDEDKQDSMVVASTVLEEELASAEEILARIQEMRIILNEKQIQVKTLDETAMAKEAVLRAALDALHEQMRGEEAIIKEIKQQENILRGRLAVIETMQAGLGNRKRQTSEQSEDDIGVDTETCTPADAADADGQLGDDGDVVVKSTASNTISEETTKYESEADAAVAPADVDVGNEDEDATDISEEEVVSEVACNANDNNNNGSTIHRRPQEPDMPAAGVAAILADMKEDGTAAGAVDTATATTAVANNDTCTQFRMDRSSKFGTCMCGRPRVEHSDTSASSSLRSIGTSNGPIGSRSSHMSGGGGVFVGANGSKTDDSPVVKEEEEPEVFDEACKQFRLDMSANTFNTCKCSFVKADHKVSGQESQPAQGNRWKVRK